MDKTSRVLLTIAAVWLALMLVGCSTAPTIQPDPTPAICTQPAPVATPSRPEFAVLALPLNASDADKARALAISLQQCIGYAQALEGSTK